MVEGHKINKKVEIADFLSRIKHLKEEQIGFTDHSSFRLAQKDIKTFEDKIIKNFILNDNPILIGIQNNGLYAVYYKYEKRAIKLILEITFSKVNIVTFYIVSIEQIPEL